MYCRIEYFHETLRSKYTLVTSERLLAETSSTIKLQLLTVMCFLYRHLSRWWGSACCLQWQQWNSYWTGSWTSCQTTQPTIRTRYSQLDGLFSSQCWCLLFRLRRDWKDYTSSCAFLFPDICFYAHTFIKMSESQVKKNPWDEFLFHASCSAFLPLAVITLIRDTKQIYQTYFRILLHESLHLALLT